MVSALIVVISKARLAFRGEWGVSWGGGGGNGGHLRGPAGLSKQTEPGSSPHQLKMAD